jgi:hypothetical protein
LRTKPLTSQQALYLQFLEDDFDFWQPIKSGLSTDIMFGPNQYDNLLNQLKNREINFDIIMSDIGSLIKSQRIETQNRHSSRNLQQGKLTFDSYYSHNDVSFVLILKPSSIHKHGKYFVLLEPQFRIKNTFMAK